MVGKDLGQLPIQVDIISFPNVYYFYLIELELDVPQRRSLMRLFFRYSL